MLLSETQLDLHHKGRPTTMWGREWGVMDVVTVGTVGRWAVLDHDVKSDKGDIRSRPLGSSARDVLFLPGGDPFLRLLSLGYLISRILACSRSMGLGRRRALPGLHGRRV